MLLLPNLPARGQKLGTINSLIEQSTISPTSRILLYNHDLFNIILLTPISRFPRRKQTYSVCMSSGFEPPNFRKLGHRYHQFSHRGIVVSIQLYPTFALYFQEAFGTLFGAGLADRFGFARRLLACSPDRYVLWSRHSRQLPSSVSKRSSGLVWGCKS